MEAKTGIIKAGPADIAFILESSYPFILGGVSAWVHQIIENFPQLNFAIIFIGGTKENYKEGIRYDMPKNITHFQVHYLFDKDQPPPPKGNNRFKGNSPQFKKISEIHDAFRCKHMETLSEIGNFDLYDGKKGVDYEQFLYSEASWDFITKQYSEHCSDSSFIDYFWTIRNIHKPLWILANIASQFPKVRAVHTASTGYAGFLSFLVNQRYKLPVILSEHGIYTRERRIDIFLSKHFRDDYVIDRPIAELSYLRNLWDRYFKTLAQLCYNVAAPIVSLSESANGIQIEEGADPEKTIIIPNGVDIGRFKKLRRSYEERSSTACFVGRLVPMKDVKGFIRAIPRVYNTIPDSKFWIIGSVDQDPEYAQECHALVENISLQSVVTFFLHQNMDTIFPKIRVLVLSAIREGMPFILLEAFAAGIPVVVTDVGACKEMVLGGTEEDRALGPAGKVVKVADTNALEQAIIEVLTDQKQWKQMSQSAIKRAERYYDQKIIMQRYKEIYEEYMI